MNVNLYDLLDWFRNPDCAIRPERFTSVAALGEYSYVENKVFPLYDAHASRIAKPLLRKIAQFKTRRSYRFPRAIVYTPAAEATKLESDVPKSTDSGETTIKEESVHSGKTKVDEESTNIDNKEESTDSGAINKEADQIKPVDAGDKGASLFTPDTTAGTRAPLRKSSKRPEVVLQSVEVTVAA